MVYEYTEAFVNPLSHDEVVHGKGSLFRKMSGDPWRKLANLRALFTYLYTRPGKKLVFMGSELASPREWNHETGLDWFLLEEKERAGLLRLTWRRSASSTKPAPACGSSTTSRAASAGSRVDDRERSILAFARFGDTKTARRRRPPPRKAEKTPELPTAEQLAARGASYLITVLNLTPIARNDYLLGVPEGTSYRVRAQLGRWPAFGGAGYPARELYDSQNVAARRLQPFDQAHPAGALRRRSWRRTAAPRPAASCRWWASRSRRRQPAGERRDPGPRRLRTRSASWEKTRPSR